MNMHDTTAHTHQFSFKIIKQWEIKIIINGYNIKKRSSSLYNNNKSKQQTQSSERFRSRRQPVPYKHDASASPLTFFFLIIYVQKQVSLSV